MITIKVHVLNFQRDLVFGWIIHMYTYILNMYNPTDKEISLKFRICAYTVIVLCIVFHYKYFCDLKMAHSTRNMSSSSA